MRKLLIVFFFLVGLIGCTIGRGSGTFPPSAEMTAEPPVSPADDGGDHGLLVANGLSETITLIERTSGIWSVTADILPTGQAPNQMLVHNGVCYIVNSLSNSIQMIDLASLSIAGEMSTGPGTNPMMLTMLDETTGFVSCYLSDEVLMVDLGLNTYPDQRVISRIPMPSPEELPHDAGTATRAAPGGLVVVADSCYVACANLSMMHVAGGPGLLVEIDIPNRSIRESYTLSGRDTTGLLHSSRFPNRLIIISAGDYQPGKGFVGTGVVESFDIVSCDVFQIVEVDGAPLNGVIGAEDILLLENGSSGPILRVDLHTGEALSSYHLPETGLPMSFASALLAMPGLVCATDFNADSMYLIDPLSGEILAELATGDGPDALALIY